MSRHRAGPEEKRIRLLTAGFVGVLALVVGLVLLVRPAGDEAGETLEPSAPATPSPSGEPTTAAPTPVPKPKIRKGEKIKPKPKGPRIILNGTGRVGSGLSVGPVTEVDASKGYAVSGPVSAAVANIPNRTGDGGFASSMRALTSSQPDFVLLNEVSRHSDEGIEAAAPGYEAYRDPEVDRSLGGVQSMNNVVAWRTDRWRLVDGGRVKLLDDDAGYHGGRAFTWDRYATWVSLQRPDGRIVSVVSFHMPTNPGKFPRQPGGRSVSRVERYAGGMDVLTATVETLQQYGSVLVGGDMNSHASQGSWTAAGKMTAQGFGYTKDRGVMYLFHPPGAEVTATQQLRVDSDHPALLTSVELPVSE